MRCGKPIVQYHEGACSCPDDHVRGLLLLSIECEYKHNHVAWYIGGDDDQDSSYTSCYASPRIYLMISSM